MIGFLKMRKEMLAKYPANKNRMRGTSTAIALETIARAIRNPDTPVRVVDHAGYLHQKADDHLLGMIHEYCGVLGLEGFKFDGSRKTVTFSFGEPTVRGVDVSETKKTNQAKDTPQAVNKTNSKKTRKTKANLKGSESSVAR